MGLIRLASSIEHLFVVPNQQYSHPQYGGRIIHVHLAATLMMLGLHTVVEMKLHPPSP